MNANLSQDVVREFLIQNPDFTDEYFAEHATSSMIQKWFQRRSKYDQIGNHLGGVTKFSLDVPQEISEDESNEENSEQIQEIHGATAAARRHSEPVTAIKNGRKAACELRGMRKKAFSQIRNRKDLRKTFDESAEVLPQFYAPKRSLRKTQSAPICKNIFNKLINSSVYLHSIPMHNRQYKIDLRSSSEDDFLKELIQDIVQDLNLRTLCSKIIVNVGIMTKSDVASLYLLEKQEQSRMVKVCFENLQFNGSGQNTSDSKFDGKIEVLDGDSEIQKVLETGASRIAAPTKV